ncbi:molybdenum ABC transporter ATP-binding protein [Bradyrhizobium ganzhouense]|uniref:molybdenum ABC transporter ATP-binding protein n=1 Tax=Bradyrhizobium ganzhouense TaxID=1179767 RepID=UPI003CF975EB
MRTARPGRIEVAFSIPAKGVAGIFRAPSCGTTTVACCIAGLERLSTGFCAIDGEVWQDETTFRAPHLRPIGYVLNEPCLFPHLSVRRNLLCAAPKRKPRPIALDEVAELLAITSLLDCSPAHLSARERQRVAIGRALLSQPRVLLMDEPLATLDRRAKREIFPCLKCLNEKLSVPMIYISHDMAEIEYLADHLVMMERGAITAAGPLSTLQSDLALPLAAGHEAAVSLDAVVGGYDGRYGLLILGLKVARLLVPAAPLAPGMHQRLRIAVSVSREAVRSSTIINFFPARVKASFPLGTSEITLVLALGTGSSGSEILARITRYSFDALRLKDGMDVFAQLKHISLVSAAAEAPSQAPEISRSTRNSGQASVAA